MELLQIAGVTIIVCSAIFVLALLDKKYQLNLNMGFNDTSWNNESFFGYGTSNTRANQNLHNELTDKDKMIDALAKRVAVLEKIVTDPTEQLKRDIEQLK